MWCSAAALPISSVDVLVLLEDGFHCFLGKIGQKGVKSLTHIFEKVQVLLENFLVYESIRFKFSQILRALSVTWIFSSIVHRGENTYMKSS